MTTSPLVWLCLYSVCCNIDTLHSCCSHSCYAGWPQALENALAWPCARLKPGHLAHSQEIWEEGAWTGLPSVPDRWNFSMCPLAHDAEALELFNRTLAHAVAASDADMPAATGRASLFAGCSRAAAEAMECVARQGEQWPEGLETTLLGLRLAEPVLDRLSQANATPRMVQEVLALWVQEARGGWGFSNPCRIFKVRPTLERLLFSPAMRASLRDAPFMAGCVFGRAIATVRHRLRIAPGDAAEGDRHALRACQLAESWAYEVRREEALAAAAPNATQDAAAGRQRAAVASAACDAALRYDTAAHLVEAALAARKGEAAEAPPWAGESRLSST